MEEWVGAKLLWISQTKLTQFKLSCNAIGLKKLKEKVLCVLRTEKGTKEHAKFGWNKTGEKQIFCGFDVHEIRKS